MMEVPDSLIGKVKIEDCTVGNRCVHSERVLPSSVCLNGDQYSILSICLKIIIAIGFILSASRLNRGWEVGCSRFIYRHNKQ